MNRTALIICCLLAIVACNQKPNEKATNDSTTLVHRTEDSTVLAVEGLNDWMNHTLKNPAGERQKLTLEEQWTEQPTMTTTYSGTKQFYQDYAPLLRWSPDSNYIIDIGTYGTVLMKDKNGLAKIESGEPDTELALLDPSAKTRTRLMFVGPSSQILDAKWKNNNQVAVMGTFDTTGHETNDTLLWIIDVKQNSFQLYNVKSHR